MEEIIIKQAGIHDLVTIQTLARQTYTETFAPYNTTENLEAYLDKAFTAAQLKTELSENNSQWFLALTENEAAGFIKINFGSAQTELQDSRAMEIERIYMLQRFQGKSIGKLLMKKAFDVARNHPVDYVWLGVWEKNTDALEFYKKQGFVRFSQHSFFVGEDEQTDWMMKLSLNHKTASETQESTSNE